MVSSIIVGSVTDKTRSYFMVTLVLLVLGVFALAECGVSLDDDRDGDVRWSMLIVSGLLGPLLPVATEFRVGSRIGISTEREYGPADFAIELQLAECIIHTIIPSIERCRHWE